MKSLLARAAESRASRSELRSLLSWPFCHPPPESPLHEAISRLGVTLRSLSPGEVLLASVDDRAGRAGSLWVFPKGATPLVEDARTTLDRVRWVVRRDLAGWRLPVSIYPPNATAMWLAGTGTHPPTSLIGESYGGALLVSMVSTGLGLAVPAELVVLCAVSPQGELRAVDGLATKLSTLTQWAPGVRRCLVAPAQVELARSLAPGLRVEGCSTVHELVDAVFPQEPTGDPAGRAKRLFEVAMDPGAGLLCWRRFGEAAACIASAPGAAPEAVWYARASLAIAERHTSGPSQVLPALEQEGAPALPRPLRERYLAQQVQQLVDGGLVDCRLVDRTCEELPPAMECTSTQLELRGALGRALARRRQYQRAAAWLAETVEAWFANGRASEAARAVSEWARVVGILKDADALESRVAPRAEALAAEFRPAARAVEVAFLALAMGRAWVQADRPSQAAPWWEDACWAVAPAWLLASRERWRARAQWAQGDREGALVRLLAIGSEPDMAALARVDAAILTGGGLREALETFEATGGAREAAWLLCGATSAAERAARLHREAPY